jgi:hypothetical protein
MKKATYAAFGVAAGYLLAPYIKKLVDKAKSGLVSLKKKLDEKLAESEEEEVPIPEEEQPEEVDPDD